MAKMEQNLRNLEVRMRNLEVKDSSKNLFTH